MTTDWVRYPQVRATDDGSPAMRHIRLLENRLDKALIKYNEAQSIRRTYEQVRQACEWSPLLVPHGLPIAPWWWPLARS